MSGTVQEAKLQTITSRQRLKRGRQPHWRTIIPGRAHLGYQRWPGDAAGRWVLRRYAEGRYSIEPLGRADDGDGDGLDYEAALAQAQTKLGVASVATRLTVRKAMARYVEFLETQGKQTKDLIGRAAAHILPRLGDIEVRDLTSASLRKWLADLARSPAWLRSSPEGKRNVRSHDPNDEEAARARRASANRVLTMLKGALNHAYDEGLINDNSAWGRRLRPLRDASAARIHYLQIDAAQRLLNATAPELRPLIRGALETGMRLGELTRLTCDDFNPDSGTLHVRRSKSGRERHVVLTEDGVSFFKSTTVGRSGLIFSRNGRAWDKSRVQYGLGRANAAARIEPPITFHGLRHTWASLAAMNGVPLGVVSETLGHVSSVITSRHYAHLSPSYVASAIRAGAPRFGAVSSNVAPLRTRRS